MYMAVALYTRRITIIGALKDWVCSYVGNFIGCIAAGGILIYCGDVFDAEPYKYVLFPFTDFVAQESEGEGEVGCTKREHYVCVHCQKLSLPHCWYSFLQILFDKSCCA